MSTGLPLPSPSCNRRMEFESEKRLAIIEKKVQEWIDIGYRLYPLNPRRKSYMCNWYTFFNDTPDFDSLHCFARELDVIMTKYNYQFDHIMERNPPVYVYKLMIEKLPSSSINWRGYE